MLWEEPVDVDEPVFVVGAPNAVSNQRFSDLEQRRTGRACRTYDRAVRAVVMRTGLGVGVMPVLMQLVPYGWSHDNPPMIRDAPWPNAASERIERVSCYSCHSNETDWPIHSYVAPMSWMVRYDVDRGRDEFNFSDWDSGDADDAIEMIEEGSMPPDRYVLIHRDARLSAPERVTLLEALDSMSDDGEHDDR